MYSALDGAFTFRAKIMSFKFQQRTVKSAKFWGEIVKDFHSFGLREFMRLFADDMSMSFQGLNWMGVCWYFKVQFSAGIFFLNAPWVCIFLTN